MSKLTDEQIEQCRQSGYTNKGLRSAFSFEKAARAIEAAATEPLLQRIAELEDSLSAWRRNAELADQANRELERRVEVGKNIVRNDMHRIGQLQARVTELERQLHEQAVSLEEARNQALEEAAVECDKRAHAGDAGALMAARAIRALKGAKE